jgi:hypothetical protein
MIDGNLNGIIFLKIESVKVSWEKLTTWFNDNMIIFARLNGNVVLLTFKFCL